MDDDEEDPEFTDFFNARLEEYGKALREGTIDKTLLAAHGCSKDHRAQIDASSLCGCFCCLSTFQPAKIETWIYDETMALCPFCEIDAVIGDASGYPITKEFLSEMCEFWFGDLPKEGRSVEKPVVIDV